MRAADLRALSGIQRRKATAGQSRLSDLGIQRRHEVDRSQEIRRFVEYGFPWSDLSQASRDSGEYDDLRKPGWLPTAIVVNILNAGDARRGRRIQAGETIDVERTSTGAIEVALPASWSGPEWRPAGLFPVEVIDGQHRLWAFDDGATASDFELPVVAFLGLDISWQAYLFWTINIKPKRINASLAFDLYPLLRSEDWLERFQGHSIYRETRAQELVEALWSHPESPWFGRINMLGEPGAGEVRQAAWVRSLVATFVKKFDGQRIQIGGLFGAPSGSDQTVLPWSGAMQAAFLIEVWRWVASAVESSQAPWARALRRPRTAADGRDPAFLGAHTVLNSDPGVRGILYVFNDLYFLAASELKLSQWSVDEGGPASDESAVSAALSSLRRQNFIRLGKDLGEGLAGFDWRTSNAPNLTQAERTYKLAIRGSGGYRELRRQLLVHLATSGGPSGQLAALAIGILGYESE